MNQHRPLRRRGNILAHDVAEAISRLVGPDDRMLPEAFNKHAIVGKLIEIAHELDDGTIDEITPIVRSTMAEKFYNVLTNTATFQAGYKRYERNSKFPVVPVTDFFFKTVYSEGECASILDAMTDLEIRQSLPKRPSRGRQANPDGEIEYMHGEDGEILVFGELAGIVVFPVNMQSNLMRAWLQRLAKISSRSIQSTVQRIEYARPETLSTAALKESIEPIAGAMARALPRPKK